MIRIVGNRPKKSLVSFVGQGGGWGSRHGEKAAALELINQPLHPFSVTSWRETPPGRRSIHQGCNSCSPSNLLQLGSWQAMAAENPKSITGRSTGTEDLVQMLTHSEVGGNNYTQDSKGRHSFGSANYRVSRYIRPQTSTSKYYQLSGLKRIQS